MTENLVKMIARFPLAALSLFVFGCERDPWGEIHEALKEREYRSLAHQIQLINKQGLEDPKGYTLLTVSCLFGKSSTTGEVLATGADPNQYDRRGRLPLTCAAASIRRVESVDHVRLLLSAGADPNRVDSHFGRTALALACDSGRRLVVKELLRNGADPNLPEAILARTPIMYAAKRGDSDILRQLLDQGGDPLRKDDLGWNALHHGISAGQSALMYSIERGEEYWKAVADINLQKAVMANDYAAIENAVGQGADIDHRINSQGVTSLMLAIESDNVKIAELLARKGANFGARAGSGQTVASFLRRASHEMRYALEGYVDGE